MLVPLLLSSVVVKVTLKGLRKIGEVSETRRLKERWLGGKTVSKEWGNA